MSNLQHEVGMRQAIVAPGKHGITSFILVLKDLKVKAEAIPVHMHKNQTATKQTKDKGDRSIKLPHYLYPQRNSGCSPQHIIMFLNTLLLFYLFRRKHWL